MRHFINSVRQFTWCINQDSSAERKYLHIYMNMIYCRGLALTSVEAEKSPNLPFACWRPRKIGGVA